MVLVKIPIALHFLKLGIDKTEPKLNRIFVIEDCVFVVQAEDTIGFGV